MNSKNTGGRKVTQVVPQQSSSSKSLSKTPEGASIDDICTFVDMCRNETCKLYHPQWGVGFCIRYPKGACKGCKLVHLDWEDLLANIENDSMFDCFSQQKFKKPDASQQQQKPKQAEMMQQVQQPQRSVIDKESQPPARNITFNKNEAGFPEKSKPNKSNNNNFNKGVALNSNNNNNNNNLNSNNKEQSTIQISEYAKRLGQKQYFGGVDPSEDDIKAFTDLEKREKQVQNTGGQSLIRWFNEIKDLIAPDQIVCSMCKKQQNTTLLRIIIDSKSQQDQQTCQNCKYISKDLKGYCEKLKNQDLLESPPGKFLEIKEKAKYEQIKQFKDTIMSNPEYEPLTVYLRRMEDLLKESNGKCMVCQKTDVKYKKYENLVYGIRDDYIVCIPCYDAKFNALVHHSDNLGDKEVFFGLNESNRRREEGIYYKLKEFEQYLPFTTCKNLQEWYDMMGENVEDAIVTCSNDKCKKEMRNDKRCKFTFQGSRLYACSLDCKLKIQHKLKQTQKENNIVQKLQSNGRGGNKENNGDCEDDNVKTDQDRRFYSDLKQLIDSNKIPRHYERNIRRIYQRGWDDLQQICKSLKNNDNDCHHALQELEFDEPYTYLKQKYNSRF